MSAQPANNSALTPAEKRKITLAAKAEKARQEQAAFVAKSKAAGGRKAKLDAKQNAVWNVDQPTSRKRTSSTAQVSEKPKKPRESKPATESDADDDAELAVPSKAKKSSKRKYAAPTITINTDESEPEAPITKKPVKAKAKAAAEVKPAAGKPSKVVASSKSTAAKISARPSTAPTAPKLIAESTSEAEKTSSDEEADVDKAENSDASDAYVEDVSPNAKEFLDEVPHVIPRKAKDVVVSDDEAQDEDVKMTDVKPKKNVKRDVKHLFDEDSDDDDYIREALEKAAAIKARKAKHASDKDVQPDVDNNSESDIEMHEAMAKALSTMPRRGFHSRRSSAASYSSGQDLLVPESDVDDLLDGDEDDEEDVKPVVQQKKPRKVSAARQKQADLEKPQVQPTTQHAGKKTVPGRQGLGKLLAADTEPALRPEDSWHVSARIIYPMPGKDIGLNSQSEELKAVLRGGIDLIKTSLLFEDAYPAIISRAGFARTYLVAAADALPAAVHIRERLPIDLKYAAVLADILLDRVNILRGNIKKAAVAVAPGFYGLVGLSPTSTKERVDDLLKDHRYIFPVDADTGRLKSELPFHNPALRAVLKDGVFIGQFKTKNQHLFISTSKKHVKNLELPDSMVSLTGTALYASLLEYRLTGERQNINFTEGAYEDTYRNHMKTLADTRAAAPVALHKVLHSLYNEVTEAKAAQPEAGSSATLINLVDIPESD